MRRNRKNNGKKERIVMIASSVFVLTALTMTGIYMQSKTAEPEDDGYTIDLAALENSAADKGKEIAQNQTDGEDAATQGSWDSASGQGTGEDDLDYMPMEAGSNLVEIPGLTDGSGKEDESESTEEPKETAKPEETGKPEGTKQPGSTGQPQAPEQAESVGQPQEAAADEVAQQPAAPEEPVVSRSLHFAESDGLLRPLSGEVLMPFSMDCGIYFSTLEQYKYNSALMLEAEEGTTVNACAEGMVVNIFDDSEIGRAVTMDLGNGYQLTYGQLKDVSVSLGSYVNAGDPIGCVAAPTKYFSVEGANLYLKLTADGVPVDPESLFR